MKTVARTDQWATTMMDRRIACFTDDRAIRPMMVRRGILLQIVAVGGRRKAHNLACRSLSNATIDVTG